MAKPKPRPEDFLPPHDSKTYTRVRRVRVRSDKESLLTFSLPKELKVDIRERAEQADRPVSQLIRYAIEVQEKRGWVDVPTVAVALKEWEAKSKK
jgi:hypothetical protein